MTIELPRLYIPDYGMVELTSKGIGKLMKDSKDSDSLYLGMTAGVALLSRYLFEFVLDDKSEEFIHTHPEMLAAYGDGVTKLALLLLSSAHALDSDEDEDGKDD